MQQINIAVPLVLNSEAVKILKMALEQALTQMSQCVRLLDGDSDLCEAIKQTNIALNVLGAEGWVDEMSVTTAG